MAQQIIPTNSGATLVSTLANQIKADWIEVVAIIGGLIAISAVLAFIDQSAEMRWLDNYGKKWK